jgi:hypothetical protein
MPEKLPCQTEAPPQLLSAVSRHIERFRFGYVALGVLCMSCASGATNLQHGIAAATSAAFNQAIHSSISGTVILKLHHCVAKNCPEGLRRILPAVVPAAIGAATCYAIHKLGIPYVREASMEPAFASLPTAATLSVAMPIYHAAYSHNRSAETAASAPKE